MKKALLQNIEELINDLKLNKNQSIEIRGAINAANLLMSSISVIPEDYFDKLEKIIVEDKEVEKAGLQVKTNEEKSEILNNK